MNDINKIPAIKLTIHFGDDERCAHGSLSTSVLCALREHGLTGATMTIGMMGYGRSRRISSVMNEYAMFNLPLTIEAVDEPAKVESSLPRIIEILAGRGLIQVQRTSIVCPPKKASCTEQGANRNA